MGADPADSFEAPLQPQQLQSFPVQIDGTLYILLENQELRTLTTAEGENLFKKAEAARSETASRIRIETPDPYFNTLGGTLAMAADGISGWRSVVTRCHRLANAPQWLASRLYRRCFGMA